MNRRRLLILTFLSALSLLPAICVIAQMTSWDYKAVAAGMGPFTLQSQQHKSYDLSPHIAAAMIETNRSIHASYVTGLNKAIGVNVPFYRTWNVQTVGQDRNQALSRWLEDMLRDVGSLPQNVREPIWTNAGGHYNHSLFWQMMKPKGSGEPAGTLGMTIKQEFGTFAQLKEKFTKAAMQHVNEGWIWLSLDGGKLKIEFLPGEESPLSSGRPVLLGIDLWKHAYEAQYGTDREKYVTAWFNVVNWDFVAQRYEELKPSP